MIRNRLQTDSELCMYALTVSTLEPKNIKEAMSDHSWIESMQDELHQFERLDVWQLVPRPDGKNIIPNSSWHNHKDKHMFTKMNCVHPTNAMLSWMPTKRLILTIFCVQMKAKILANILKNHPLRFSIAASSSVPWIYLGKFWHTLKEDGSKYRIKFVLDRKELMMTLDDFRSIFQLPQATNNNHECFVVAPKFSEWLEPRSNKESLEVEITTEVQPLNTIEEEDESEEDDYKLKRRENGKEGLIMERQQNQTDVAKMVVDAIKQNYENLQAEITSQINNAITNHIPSQDDLPIWLALKYKFERLYVSNTPCRPSAVLPREQDDHHDDAHPEGENNSYATDDDDELPTEKVSQELVEEISQTIDEAKLHKVVNEMLRQ
ncbi:hypothetical protein Tco_0443365 [Tanacetum coccineum]